MEIRDTRNGEWHWVYNAVVADPHLTPAEKLIYSALSTFAGCQEIRPTFKILGERAYLSERMAKSAVKKLVELEYVQITKGGGRGHANVYLLTKRPKGCKICTVSKGCKLTQKRVQNTTVKGAKSAPQLDKELNKEIDKISDASIAEQKINELIELFEPLNPIIYKKWFSNTTQRSAVERLNIALGDKLEIAINTAVRANGMKYAPIITTPLQLEDKLSALRAFVKKERATNNNKPKVCRI